jgi:hypothetical protein
MPTLSADEDCWVLPGVSLAPASMLRKLGSLSSQEGDLQLTSLQPGLWHSPTSGTVPDAARQDDHHTEVHHYVQ